MGFIDLLVNAEQMWILLTWDIFKRIHIQCRFLMRWTEFWRGLWVIAIFIKFMRTCMISCSRIKIVITSLNNLINNGFRFGYHDKHWIQAIANVKAAFKHPLPSRQSCQTIKVALKNRMRAALTLALIWIQS